ncbi:tetratricopeptide repeat-containing sensor histidine kinase [Algoriphagus halophytocola]|uniref:Tetratricopeptide repeat protein n=1 Tax=Algoriphagus halophytocola TaxID=2991499 RepID=A0ABY6MIC8_9BACT|nr:tetratricopeptide repeat protein [Algoriphagus sp. TR-M5]UZD22948.1 tetratricopeptide repeat protein [Algoriphagus sp. TR-M5]
MRKLKSAQFIFFWIMALCLISFSAIAKQSVTDSLRNELTKNKAKDTVRVKLLINLSNSVVWNDVEEALELAEQAYEISEEIAYQKGKAFSLRQIGVSYYIGSDFLRAMEYTQLALKESTTLDDIGFQSSLHNNLGNIYTDLKRYDEALAAYNDYIENSRKSANENGIVVGLVNRALIYSETDQLDAAIKDFEQALELSESNDFTYFTAVILNNIGQTYKSFGQYEKAEPYLKKAISKAQEDNQLTKSSALGNLAIVYHSRGKYDSALVLAEHSLELAKENGSLERQKEAWNVLNLVYDSLNNSEESLKAYRAYISLRDSILGEENKSELTRKELEYKMELKDALSQEEIKRQTLIRNISIIGSIGVILIMGILFTLNKKKRDALESKREADFKLKTAENELRLLRAQLNPHFIFNSINSVTDYILKNDTDDAVVFLTSFSQLMRLTLEYSVKENIYLEDDLKWISLYLDVESNRLRNKLTYSIEVDPSIDSSAILVPPMMLQPFVENSIWHGIAPKDGSGTILIKVFPEKDLLVFQLDDDGVGLKENTKKSLKKEHKSYGIELITSRIEVMNSLSEKKAQISITDKKEGVRVTIKLPLHLAF